MQTHLSKESCKVYFKVDLYGEFGNPSHVFKGYKKRQSNQAENNAKRISEEVEHSRNVNLDRSNSSIENSLEGKSDDSELLNGSIESSVDGSEMSQYYSDEAYMFNEAQKSDKKKDDNIRYYEFQIKHLTEEDSPFKSNEKLMFLNIRDITEMIRSLEKIKDQVYYDAIENNFSHELMTPLNPITTCCSLIKEGVLSLYSKFNEMPQESSN